MADEPTANADSRVIHPGEEPYLALEIRSGRLGFAVFRGLDLIDSGVCVFRLGKTGTKAAIKKLAFLLDLYAPSMVLARQVRRVRDSSSKRTVHVLRGMRADLERRSLRLAMLDRRDVARYFGADERSTKHEIARLIAARFEELKWKLPPPRKPWNHEAHFVAMFDAVATAVAWSGGVLPPPEET